MSEKIKKEIVVRGQNGGKREGAGRKPLKIPRIKTTIYVTEAEKEEVKAFIEKLRKEGVVDN